MEILHLLIYVLIILVAKWPPLGEELLSRLTVRLFVISSISHFGLQDKILLWLYQFLVIVRVLLFEPCQSRDKTVFVAATDNFDCRSNSDIRIKINCILIIWHLSLTSDIEPKQSDY